MVVHNFMNLYVSTAEIKAYLGISSSSEDTRLAMFNKQATALVNGIIGVTDLSLHRVTSEVHDAIGRILKLREKHAVAIGTIMDDTTEYTQTDAYDLDNDVLYLQNYLLQGPRKAFVTYAAGWNTSGTGKITVSDYANIGASATITLGAVSSDGFTITRGVDWTAGTSNATEATAIAAALDAKAGVRSFAVGAVVYIIEDTALQVATRTLATSDSTRLAKDVSTLGNVDFPEDIRMAVFMLVASYRSNAKNPRMKSYTIGSKSVSFGNDSEFNSFKTALAPYLRARVYSV